MIEQVGIFFLLTWYLISKESPKKAATSPEKKCNESAEKTVEHSPVKDSSPSKTEKPKTPEKTESPVKTEAEKGKEWYFFFISILL